jgi:D-amino-acid oxidase
MCSQGAGGLWMPYHCDDPRTDRWAIETLDELHPMGTDPTNDLVEQVPTICLKSKHDGPAPEDFLAENYKNGTGGKSPLPAWSTDPRLQFQHVTAHQLSWQNIVHQLRIPNEQELLDAGYPNAWFFRPPIVDCPKMLQVRTILMTRIVSRDLLPVVGLCVRTCLQQ